MRIWIRDEDQQLLHYALGNHHLPRLDDLTQCFVEGHPEFIVTGQLVDGGLLGKLREDFSIGEAKYWGPPPLKVKTPVVQFNGERRFMLSPYLVSRYRTALTPTRRDMPLDLFDKLQGDITADFMSRLGSKFDRLR